MFHCMKNLRWQLNFLRYEHSLKEISPVLPSSSLKPSPISDPNVWFQNISIHTLGVSKPKLLIRKVSTKTVVSSRMGVGSMGGVWALSGTTVHSLFQLIPDQKINALFDTMHVKFQLKSTYLVTSHNLLHTKMVNIFLYTPSNVF